MDSKIRYKPFGSQAILIEWEAIIDERILDDIRLFKTKIQKEKSMLFSDFIIGYNSLTIIYKEEITNFSKEVENLKSIYKTDFKLLKKEKFLWEIPVCYHPEFGIDLEEISTKSKIPIDKIVKLHSEKTYTVFFIGFLPGFLYLGGLDSKLFFDRKPNPRLQVAKGSVAIGGQQTGIYPLDSAGGWNIIGKTPVDFFNIKNEKPCFASSGDTIKFTSISLKEYNQIEKEIETNTYQLSKKLLND